MDMNGVDNLGLQYFKLAEFDSPDEPGSGINMDADFLTDLDEARDRAGIPFRINSGYRTKSHNSYVGGRVGSAHLKGLAADIGYSGSRERYLILSALMSVGFCRFGFSKTFIHVDSSESLDQEVMWTY